MYFDPRLWRLTRGLRRWIALAVLLGLVASVAGIARFAILGVLLSHVFNGAGFLAVAVPAAGVAVAVMLRGIVDHQRTMISHRTATVTCGTYWPKKVCNCSTPSTIDSMTPPVRSPANQAGPRAAILS